MELSSWGISKIMEFEGWRNRPYKDEGGYWTVGIGHRISPKDRNKYFSDQEIRTLFDKDVQKFVEYVNRHFPLIKKQKQFDMVVSLIFNTGGINGTRLYKLLQTDPCSPRVSDEWIEFRNTRGKFSVGLLKRRLMELYHYYDECNR